MSSNGKGKAVASGGGERKRGSGGDDDKTGGGNKKKNRAVLRFFEDAADFSDQDSDRDSDDSDLNFDIEGFKKISHFGLFLCSTLLGSWAGKEVVFLRFLNFDL